MIQLSKHEERLLNAALNPDAAVAVRSWQEWASKVGFEYASYPELRLLTAVYAHISRVAPLLKLPEKLRGKARATFTANQLLANGCLPTILELSQHFPVLLAKGLGICIRFDAWSSRTMGDVDVHIQSSSLASACNALARSGWVLKYGMTWNSLLHRSSLRRNSWNLTKGKFDLDLHWRLREGISENWLTKHMWASAESFEFLGRTVLIQSPEFALVTALDHGFKGGTRADRLQTIVDAASLLPICDAKRLLPLLNKMDVVGAFSVALSVLKRCGLAEIVSKAAISSTSLSVARFKARLGRLPLLKPKPETALLNRPVYYRFWERLGRESHIERLMLRILGPFSKPLTFSGKFKHEYDLRDCAVIDEIGGPGWSWPEPEHTCFWADRADARLLVPLRRVSDWIIILDIADVPSPNDRVNVFANGTYLSTLQLSAAACEYSLKVSCRVLFGPWVELSFRPEPYLGDNITSADQYSRRRSLPAHRVRISEVVVAAPTVEDNQGVA